MESGELPLEASVAAYKRGSELVQYCAAQLERVEKQVKVLEGDMLKPFATEDDDEDLTTADDVEADLAHILDERLRERSEVDEDDEEEEEPPSAADPETSIQPKRPDEKMCPQCFLLVRKGAPVCPVGDDTCPLFS